MPKIDLKKTPTHFRSTVAKGISEGGAVIANGGDYGAGLIKEFAVISRGEALGHEMWIDTEMLQQVALSINSSADGIKSRFAHPSMSSDGTGKYLGRAKNAWVDGDVVRADLHLGEAARKAPDGDLAAYVIQLASDDPDAFGASIAFDRDEPTMLAHKKEHYNQETGFASPDELNTDNFPHVRLSKLRAVDAVDEPAANPNGLFHAGEKIAHEADQLLSYSLGLSSERPKITCLDIDPDRLSGFVARFLQAHDLSIVSGQSLKEEPVMAKETEAHEPQVTRESLLSEIKGEMNKFSEKFGERGLGYFNSGLSFDQALEKEIENLRAEFSAKIEAKDATIKELETKLSHVDLGEIDPAECGAGAEADKNEALTKHQEKFTRSLGRAQGMFAASMKLPNRN